jgi:hypothetical protein
MAAEKWLPDESIYLEKRDLPEARPSRPWNQGDIFLAPLAILGKPKKPQPGQPEPDPISCVKVKDEPVVLLGHPCSIRGGANLAILQNVAHVRPAKQAEIERFAQAEERGAPWDTYYKVFPLPAFRDEMLWVVDFNVLGTVTFTSLKGSRIAILSKEGWAALQKRYAWHALRLAIDYGELLDGATLTWNELDLWEVWVSRGLTEADFQTVWLEEPLDGSSQYAGTKRRDLLEFAPDALLADMPS